MTDRSQVDDQLKKLGVKRRYWGAAEINELPSILMPHEEIRVLLRGWYENGFATLLATTERILLVDKKLFHLTIEDVRYEMVAEIDYNARLADSSVRINTVNKVVQFTSFNQRRLRELTNYVQQRVMELRQHQPYNAQQYEQTPISSPQLAATFQANLEPQITVATTEPVANMPLVNPAEVGLQSLAPRNHFTNMPLITKHNFLPKVPRRWRPEPS